MTDILAQTAKALLSSSETDISLPAIMLAATLTRLYDLKAVSPAVEKYITVNKAIAPKEKTKWLSMSLPTGSQTRAKRNEIDLAAELSTNQKGALSDPASLKDDKIVDDLETLLDKLHISPREIDLRGGQGQLLASLAQYLSKTRTAFTGPAGTLSIRRELLSKLIKLHSEYLANDNWSPAHKQVAHKVYIQLEKAWKTMVSIPEGDTHQEKQVVRALVHATKDVVDWIHTDAEIGYHYARLNELCE
jgi:hypothetical protein